MEKQFPDCLKWKYSEDPMFKGILNNPENFANFVIEEGLIFFRLEGTVKLAIPNVTIDGTSVRESIIKQGHTILAHLGGHKTLTYLRDQVWWKTIVQDINDYCKSCNLCAINKSLTTKPRGLLKRCQSLIILGSTSGSTLWVHCRSHQTGMDLMT